MSTSYILFKTVKDSTGKRQKVYLSVTGKWIKSTANATVKSREVAEAMANELSCMYRVVSFKN